MLRLIAALVVVLPLCAYAQPNTLTFSASTTTGAGSVVPSLTWSTSPPAQSCVASGAANWTGTKAASGSQTLPAATSSQTYNLECTWPGDSIITYRWNNPTTNTDGSAYTDPKTVRIKHTFDASMTDAALASAQCGSAPIVCTDVPQTPAPASMRTVTGITQTGPLRAVALAINQLDAFSTASNIASKVFTGLVTVNRSVGITVNPAPGPVTGLVAE